MFQLWTFFFLLQNVHVAWWAYNALQIFLNLDPPCFFFPPHSLENPLPPLEEDFFSQAKRQEDVYFGQNALCEFQGTDRFEITVGDMAQVEW